MDYINQSPPMSPTYSLIHSQVFIEYLLYVSYSVRHWGHNGGYDSMSALYKVVDECGKMGRVKRNNTLSFIRVGVI